MNPFLAQLLEQLASTLIPVLVQAGTEGVQLLEGKLASALPANNLPHINTAAPTPPPAA